MQIYQNYLSIISEGNKNVSDLIKEFNNVVKQNKFITKEGETIHYLNQDSYPIPVESNNKSMKTKWETFAEEKGIKQRKKSRRIFSGAIGEFVPRFGSKSEKNMIMRMGITEASESICKLRNEKKKRIIKNQKNHKANLKRNQNK